MGSRDGDYSRFIYNELNRYLTTIWQQKVPVVDADLNDFSESIVRQVRRATAFGVGDGSPNQGWKIAESASPSNNFTVKGGDGTVEGAGWIFENGFQAIIPSDLEYVSTDRDIHAQITGLTDTVLTDSSANFAVDELAGRDLVPDIDNPGTTFAITANTATTITVASGLLAASAIGKHYRVNLSTPSGARTDKIYLDLYLDEVDSVEDPNLIHSLSTGNVEAARRLKLRTNVRVVEDADSPPLYLGIPGDFVDADTNQHFTVLLATLDRTAAASISASEIVDDRKIISPGQTLRISEQDGSPSVKPVFEIVVTNGSLIDSGGGVVELDLGEKDFLEAASADISGAGNIDSDTEKNENDAEVYQKLTGNAANQSVDVTYAGKMLQSAIKRIVVPHKFSATTGNADLTIAIKTDDGSGTTIASKVVTIGTARAETEFLSADFSAQPTDRFLIVATVTLDSGQIARIGGIKMEFE